MSNKDTIIEALTMQLKLEREGNLALAKLAKREWVGLATGEAREFYESDLSREELIHKIDEFLQEKNT